MIKQAMINVRVTSVLKKRVQEQLEYDGISMSDLLTTAMLNYIGIIPELKYYRGGRPSYEDDF